MRLRIPYIDWRKPWILQEIAEITESKLLLLKVNFFSTEITESKLFDEQ